MHNNIRGEITVTETEIETKIDFSPFALEDKKLYEEYLYNESERGCEFSFANMYLWGRQNFTVLNDHIVIFSQFGKYFVYPYPLGKGDKKAVIDAIIADAKEKGIDCRISGMSEAEKENLEELYPGMFSFSANEGSFDYVYSIDDLADLKGKKYHGKRNHLNRFYENYPNYTVQEICEDNADSVKAMLDGWYRDRMAIDPDNDYRMERAALEKAFRDFRELGLEGLALMNGDEVLAFTFGSHLSEDTIDVHFEKARPDVNGAYTAINCEFARYIRKKYPSVRYLDREEDMGIDGLRKAKKSYHPHHMVKKYRATLLEE